MFILNDMTELLSIVAAHGGLKRHLPYMCKKYYGSIIAIYVYEYYIVMKPHAK